MNVRNIPDTELVARCRMGDGDAQSMLYRKYYPMMLVVAQHFVDDDAAKDIVHDAVLMALISLDSLKEPAKLAAWLRRITRNLALNYVKHQRVAKSVTIDSVEEQLLTHDDEPPLLSIDMLMDMVRHLPDGYGRVFRLNSLQGLNHRQISELLGITESASRSQLTRARKLLRTMIQNYVVPSLLVGVIVLYWLNRNKLSDVNEQNSIATDNPVAIADSLPSQDSQPCNVMSSLLIGEHLAASKGHTDTVSVPVVETNPTEQVDTAVIAEEAVDTTVQPILPPPLHPLLQHKHLASGKTVRDSEWSMTLAYNGASSPADRMDGHYSIIAKNVVHDVPSEVPGDETGKASDTIDNWIDYYHYLDMLDDDAETRSLRRIVEQNVLSNPSKFINRNERHEMPLSVELSISRALSANWNLGAGLRYTRLRSTFDYGYEQAYVTNRQTIHYLGIPLNFSYKMAGNAHWCVYGTLGTAVDLPIRATLDTRHVLHGEQIYHRSDAVSIPLQWSVDAGLGLQYNLSPRFGIFVQPSVRYYFDNGTKTIRAAHPWNVTIPSGIRITW